MDYVTRFIIIGMIDQIMKRVTDIQCEMGMATPEYLYDRISDLSVYLERMRQDFLERG